jgi:hypothetical protein
MNTSIHYFGGPKHGDRTWYDGVGDLNYFDELGNLHKYEVRGCIAYYRGQEDA